MIAAVQDWRLPLMCRPPNPRPRKLTDAMLREAGAVVMQQFVKDGTLAMKELDEAIDDLLAVTRHDRRADGYQIARDLDRYHHWDCTRDMVDVFDEFSGHCSDLLDNAEKEWAAENPMEPPFAVGQIVKTPHGEGPIESIYEYGPARYIVGVGSRHLVVLFEDCTAIERYLAAP